MPLGYGSNVFGCERGFDEFKRRGEIDRVPRLFGVQAANCAPYYAAFKAGVEHLVPTEITPTIAEGIASSKPTRVRKCCAACAKRRRDRRGRAKPRSWRRSATLARKGFYVEPTSAAAAAGLSRLIETRRDRPDETTVLVLTGSGLKASERIGELLNVGARARGQSFDFQTFCPRPGVRLVRIV